MIYFDSAATTLQKPPQVARAVGRAVNQLASPGRGGHPPSQLAGETAYRCRELAASMFHIPNSEQIIFTMNATHALNIAIRSLVNAGDKVVISPWEHNAVTRTLHSIPDVDVVVAQSKLFDKKGIIEGFDFAISSDVKAVIFTHMSNVFGYILPIQEIAEICSRRKIPFIIDASQSAGNQIINGEELGASYIAMPGHKGLFGPQGTGLLLCGDVPKPIITGGTGSESRHPQMPAFLPDRLEAGTHNMAGIAGLLAGMEFVQRTGIETIHHHECALINRLSVGLENISSVEQYRSVDPTLQGGVLSFRVDGWDCEEVGEALAEQGICVRAGLHCAPIAHHNAGTLESGTIRISVSPFNTLHEVDFLLQILHQVLEQ